MNPSLKLLRAPLVLEGMIIPNCNTREKAVSEEQLVLTQESWKRLYQKIKILNVLLQVENIATNDGVDMTGQSS